MWKERWEECLRERWEECGGVCVKGEMQCGCVCRDWAVCLWRLWCVCVFVCMWRDGVCVCGVMVVCVQRESQGSGSERSAGGVCVD